jgi:hypothetical protein
MVGMLCYRPDGSAARLLVGFHRGSYDTATLVEALTGLHAFLGGAPVNLIWDNLKAHKSTAMGEFLARPGLAAGQLSAGLCARVEPGRGAVGQRQRRRVGQPLLPDRRGGDRHRAGWA